MEYLEKVRSQLLSLRHKRIFSLPSTSIQIEKMMGGTLVDGTAYVVDSSELDAGEQWTPIGFDPVALGYPRALD
jgi:hypothetical protein